MKCSSCGKELITGDIHQEIGICNHCYNSVFSDVFINGKEIAEYQNVVNISVDDFGEHKKALHRIAVLEEALKLMSISYFGDADCIRFLSSGIQVNSSLELYEYFIKQAEKKTGGQKMKIYNKIQKEDWILVGKDELVTLDKLLKCYRICQRMWLEGKRNEGKRQNPSD